MMPLWHFTGRQNPSFEAYRTTAAAFQQKVDTFVEKGKVGEDRAVWGTNGLPWKENLDPVDALGLKPEARRKLIRDNARELFRL